MQSGGENWDGGEETRDWTPCHFVSTCHIESDDSADG